MKILLTGSAGYVGSKLLPKLQAAGHSVIGADVGWFANVDEPVDVRYLTDIKGVDCVIHLAAISNDPSVSFYPRLSWETGCLATMRLADAASRAGARFIFASSVSVYGADRGMVTEDMDLRPLSDYNKVKMVAERVLLSYADTIPVQIVRPATICGLSPRMRLDLTVNMLTVQALKNGVMTVFGGAQMRPSIHIDDMCDLYLWLLERPQVIGIFNAGFENYSLLEIAHLVKEHVEDARIDISPQRDQRSYQVNSGKLIAAGFHPRKNVQCAIRELIDAWGAGTLKDEPQHNNLNWMQYMGIRDE